MEPKHAQRLRASHHHALQHTPLHILNIPDNYQYMDPRLVLALRYAIDSILKIHLTTTP